MRCFAPIAHSVCEGVSDWEVMKWVLCVNKLSDVGVGLLLTTLLSLTIPHSVTSASDPFALNTEFFNRVVDAIGSSGTKSEIKRPKAEKEKAPTLPTGFGEGVYKDFPDYGDEAKSEIVAFWGKMFGVRYSYDNSEEKAFYRLTRMSMETEVFTYDNIQELYICRDSDVVFGFGYFSRAGSSVAENEFLYNKTIDVFKRIYGVSPLVCRNGNQKLSEFRVKNIIIRVIANMLLDDVTDVCLRAYDINLLRRAKLEWEGNGNKSVDKVAGRQ